MTMEDARQIYLSFEGAVEGSHHGHPDFRINGKIFASLQPEKDRTTVRIPADLAASLAAKDPDHRRVVGISRGLGWLVMDAEDLTVDELRPLAELAFEERRA